MVLDFFLISLILLIFIFIFTSFGNLMIIKINNEKLSPINPIILGFSAYTILLYFCFFFFKFSIYLSFSTVFVFLFTISIINLKKNYSQISSIFLINILLIFFLIIIFSFLSILYQDNFFVFRGNHWDYFYYLSQSILVHKFNIDELLELSKSSSFVKNSNNFFSTYFTQSFDKIFFHNERVGIFLIYAVLFIFPVQNIFISSFIFKVFLGSLLVCSIYSFLQYLGLKKINNIILCLCYSISFWLIYLFEIEALAQLSSISIFASLIIYSFLIYKEEKLKFSFDIFIVTLLSCALYILYFELFAVLVLWFLFCFISNYKKLIDYFFLFRKNFLISAIFFLIIIFISYDNTLLPIVKRILERSSANINSFTKFNDINLWGYYGAFVLGKESIISQQKSIDLLKILALNSTNFDLLKNLVSININNGFDYFYLNLIPSLAGLYHFGIPIKFDNLFYFFIFISLFINYYIASLIVKNILILRQKNKNFYFFFRNIFIFITFLVIIFSYLGQLNYILKIYFSFSFLIFIFLVINFDLKKGKEINYIFLVMIFTFFIYKFSINNDGINRYDSFPSILNVQYKKNFTWRLNVDSSNQCKGYLNAVNNFKNDKFQWIKYNYINIRVYKINRASALKPNCTIQENGKEFLIIKKN